MVAALEGVLILELTQTLAGPFGAMLLVDLGAEIIKIEPPGMRHNLEGGVSFKDESVYFLAVNRNKKGITLDLKTPKGKEVFLDLSKRADVVFDNYRTGVLEKLGIDYESLRSINPRIISCSITGFGSSGPYRDRPAYDLLVQAMSGGMSITGNPPPARAGLPIGDLCGGMFAAHGVLAALYARERTGKGQKIEVALLDGQIALLTYCVPDFFVSGRAGGPVGIGQRADPTYQMYQTRDEPIVIAIPAGTRFWENLCQALGSEELTTDPRFDSSMKRRDNSPEVTAIIQKKLLNKSAAEWLACFLKEGVPAGPVNTIEKALIDEQVWHQGMVVPVDFGGEAVLLAGNPIKMSGADPVFRSPPTFGQHTDEVLSQLLGYSSTKIAELRREKVIE